MPQELGSAQGGRIAPAVPGFDNQRMPGLAETADVTLDKLETVREALRNDDLRQALYSASPYMIDALINLHGEMHRRRRRAEQPIFSRNALALREETLVEIGETTLAPHLATG